MNNISLKIILASDNKQEFFDWLKEHYKQRVDLKNETSCQHVLLAYCCAKKKLQFRYDQNLVEHRFYIPGSKNVLKHKLIYKCRTTDIQLGIIKAIRKVIFQIHKNKTTNSHGKEHQKSRVYSGNDTRN